MTTREIYTYAYRLARITLNLDNAPSTKFGEAVACYEILHRVEPEIGSQATTSYFARDTQKQHGWKHPVRYWRVKNRVLSTQIK